MITYRTKKTNKGKEIGVDRNRIASFGFRSIPPNDGSAGADKFAMELYPRLVKRGLKVTAYNRIYDNIIPEKNEYEGVKLVHLKTVRKRGLDTVLHSLKATFHIIKNNTADIIHIHNGGNSIWGALLKLFGKRVFVSQDGVDWKREKWPWYGKLFLYISSYITAKIPDRVIFDNIYSKSIFEKKFKKSFDFIPYGSELPEVEDDASIIDELCLEPKEYFIFVGRFIPDKGLQYLVPAFERVNTSKKLILVGGSPNPSMFEKMIKRTNDKRIIFPGYIYGSKVINLIKNSYAYIQPSDIEGLSPVILMVMGLKVPLICSDIVENLYIVDDTAITFKKSDIGYLKDSIDFALNHPEVLDEKAMQAKKRVDNLFSWEKVTDDHKKLFLKSLSNSSL